MSPKARSARAALFFRSRLCLDVAFATANATAPAVIPTDMPFASEDMLMFLFTTFVPIVCNFFPTIHLLSDILPG